MEADKIELVGKIDTFYGDFSGEVFFNMGKSKTTIKNYHFKKPIEELLEGLADMLRYDGKVIITYVENKEIVQKARNYLQEA